MMIKEITDLLAVFGGNLPLIAVGCVEGIAAVVLLGTGLQRKRKKEKRESTEHTCSILYLIIVSIKVRYPQRNIIS